MIEGDEFKIGYTNITNANFSEENERAISYKGPSKFHWSRP